jgi:hypothetical protein
MATGSSELRIISESTPCTFDKMATGSSELDEIVIFICTIVAVIAW